MRKLIVGLIAVAVLAMGAPAMAQSPSNFVQPGGTGHADPLGLISSGAVIPFVGTGGAISGNNVALSFLEVTSPTGDNSNFHMFFFDSNCTRRGDSIGLPVTENGVAVLRVDNVQPTDLNPSEGLIAAAGVDSTGFALTPLREPVQMRMLWFDVTAGFGRTLEPISIANAEMTTIFCDPVGGTPPSPLLTSCQTWNPLRSAATFFTPMVGSATGFDTTIYFVCPNTAVTNDINSPTSGAFPIAAGFAPLLDPSGHSPQAGTSQLRVRVYDTNEIFLRDLRTTCSCLTARRLDLSPSAGGISDVFHDASAAPDGTYTEVEGDTTTRAAVCGTTPGAQVFRNPGAAPPDCSTFVGVATGPVPPGCTATTCNVFNTVNVISPSVVGQGPTVFTGYRAMPIGINGGHGAPGGFSLDIFGRLSNGNFHSIRGDGINVGDVLPGVEADQR